MIALDLPLMPGQNDADTALIKDCQAGNIEAFGELVARHRDGIYNFARHTVGSPTDAQDLAQETFVRAYAAIGRFRCGAPVEPWLYTIAANLCRSHFRSRRRAQGSLEVEPDIESIAAPASADPAHALELHDEHQRALRAIRMLEPDQRMVVVLRHLQNRSYRDIATILGLPVSTVEHRLRAARRVLWEAIDDGDSAMAPDAKGVRDGLR